MTDGFVDIVVAGAGRRVTGQAEVCTSVYKLRGWSREESLIKCSREVGVWGLTLYKGSGERVEGVCQTDGQDWQGATVGEA